MVEVIAIIATLMALGGNIPYVWSVVKGETRPHPYTWFVGSIVSATVFFGMFVKGAGIAALPVAASEIFTLIIFLLSLKYGFKGATRNDSILLVIALSGLVPWVITKDPTISVVIAVLIDVISFIPTIRKTWHIPRSEHPLLYASNVLRHVLILYSLGAYNVATMLHSVAMICINAAMVSIIFWRRRKSLSKSSGTSL